MPAAGIEPASPRPQRGNSKTIKLSFAVLLVLCLATVVTSFMINGDLVDGRSSYGGRGSFRSSSSSSSSGSSGSSEEHGHHHGHRPPHRPPNRPPYRPPRPPRQQCDDGWLEFKRPNGVWCILNACNSMGAVLTGFQNSNEGMTVADEALKITTALGQLIAVDRNTFQWTDGDTTGIEGLKWGIGEPDNTNWPGSTACIQQFIMAPNYVGEPGDSAGWKGKFVHGDLDKYQCNSRVHSWTRLYICGKRGVRR
ncbi:hypothetical protein L5515_009186 [Caenorhabditis briggsae]|uniref:C-type lectin domain-containing protein n=1 Tax=Caenorhabditis briggsae TaxID=6238 RepID=A0AAE9FAU1_CAEBR|nr:hypothetical protein L5515_009186 [Caenorhabditis briggsae]